MSETGNLPLLLGSAGIKINPVGRLLIVGNVLFKLGDRGLQDKLTPSSASATRSSARAARNAYCPIESIVQTPPRCARRNVCWRA